METKRSGYDEELARHGSSTTRSYQDIEWGISIPLEDEDWQSKRVYVWFEAVQDTTHAPAFGLLGMLALQVIRTAKMHGKIGGKFPIRRRITQAYLLHGKGQHPLPYNHLARNNYGFERLEAIKISHLPGPGELVLEDNVCANEYLMLQGGQFSKSRKHAMWLPSYLEQYDADSLRYLPIDKHARDS